MANVTPAGPRRLLLHFSRFGPYHLARTKSAVDAFAADSIEVRGLEIASTEDAYAWKNRCHEDVESIGAEIDTIFPSAVYESIAPRAIRSQVLDYLDRVRPIAIAIAGWASPDAVACLHWCKKNSAAAILMSETRAADGVRRWWKEFAKSRRVRRYDAAIVGGKSHADYLYSLGMARSRLKFGYNVVDNTHFAEAADNQRTFGFTRTPYLLASNRFVPRKNLLGLVRAYSQYVKRHDEHVRRCNLCLLGDGDQKPELVALCNSLGIRTSTTTPWEEDDTATECTVYFPGFRQLEALTKFYALAFAFVHPAMSEPWGLVINEAMACGLPILASRNVGAAEELVVEGMNGLQFDPHSTDEISNSLRTICSLAEQERKRWGVNSRRLLEQRAPLAAFGRGLRAAFMSATEV